MFVSRVNTVGSTFALRPSLCNVHSFLLKIEDLKILSLSAVKGVIIQPK